ncbi:MAG: bifunctional hydroxymethylpyrimidine kinase/phosphomethylpyrimidine kinase [Bacteroidia bacterium]|nr:bifunctional hydroxymethylpyrimidine kinase/phosphomethylpyrimidine kinase [Bacteroidia bacterium]
MTLPPVLTIAGSDSIGGAGVQADLKAFTALGTYGMSVITALTAQNTLEVRDILALDASFVQSQLVSVFSDIRPQAIKTGMLANETLIRTVLDFLIQQATDIPWVVDPVLVATSGARLLAAGGESQLRLLCARATVVTPNLPEAAVLADSPEPVSEKEVYTLGISLSTRYPHPFWLLKGGHASWERHTVTNWLFQGGKLLQRWVYPRLSLPRPPHGTGCTLASAIAARLAHGDSPIMASLTALDFVHQALLKSDLSLGKGATVLNPCPLPCATS